MKQTWIYGPKRPANTKQSKLGFPSIIGSGSDKPPLPCDGFLIEKIPGTEKKLDDGNVTGLCRVHPVTSNKN